MCQLYLRNFLRLLEFSSDNIYFLLKLAKHLKNAKKNNEEIQYLKGKNIVLIFEKESTRTRCAFEVAAYDQGANVTYVNSINSQIGYKESIKDTARILGRMYDGIQYRGHHNSIEILAQYAGIPVWNGLTSEFHPTQLLADLLTMQEFLPHKPFNDIKIVYIGDARNNIGNTMLEAAALVGLNLYIISPKQYWPELTLVNDCIKIAKLNGGTITLTCDIIENLKQADFIYTDVWVSMGEIQDLWEERIKLLRNYQVNNYILKLTENSEVKFMHCLPAIHDRHTIISRQIAKKYHLHNGVEVTDEVFESKHSIVFEQAENRLHTIKAIMVATLCNTIIFK
ncbi:MAG: ornithine carbamoyltransferase [Pantoea sp. Brub]|nr:ornithine carbamoyltransferase [Pantoea sp. Brub]